MKFVERVDPVLDYSVRGLCTRRYPNHPRGCPNFGKRPTCPPQAPLLENVFDLSQPVYAVWNVFDLASHVDRMREKHPDWTWRQLVNCLYWQGGARKVLRRRVEDFMGGLRAGHCPLYCPEACGVNVTETMKSIGEILEWPPKTKTYQVALVGRIKR